VGFLLALTFVGLGNPNDPIGTASGHRSSWLLKNERRLPDAAVAVLARMDNILAAESKKLTLFLS
jgi:hypothetical protein